ncbi:Retinoblastoma-like protein 1,Retinoblastoma-like protein 2 [Balamuthia mandrillaris]
MQTGDGGAASGAKPRLIQDDINAIRTQINSLCEKLELTNGGEASGKLHPYGSVRIAKERQTFEEHIQHISSVLGYYKTLCATQDKIALSRYLNLLKDRANLNAQVDWVKDSLLDCRTIGGYYLSLRDSTTSSSSTSASSSSTNIHANKEGGAAAMKQQHLVQSLRNIAEKLHLEFYSYEEEDMDLIDMGGDLSEESNCVTVTISSKTFVLDILVARTGTVMKASLTYTSADEGQETEGETIQQEEVNEELTTLLQQGKLESFEDQIRNLKRLDALLQSYPNVPLRVALRALEADLLKLHSEEMSRLNDREQVLLHGHGIPLHQCKGLSLHYYASPLVLLKEKKTGVHLLDTHKAVISLIRGATPVVLPLVSQLAEDEEGSGKHIIVAPEKRYQDSRECFTTEEVVNFEMSFHPPVPVALSVLRRILDIASTGTLRPTPQEEQSKTITKGRFACLENLLCQNVLPTASEEEEEEEEETAPSFLHGDREGTLMRYTFNVSRTTGLILEHIPFYRLSSILPVLNLLRQQLVFNELFQSCCNTSFSSSCDNQTIHHKRAKTAHHNIDVQTTKQQEEYKEEEDETTAPIAAVNPTRPMIEITTNAPTSLNLTLLHPISQSLLCVEVHVKLGGRIVAAIHHDGGEVCSSEYLSKLLNKCHSIPMCMNYLFPKT